MRRSLSRISRRRATFSLWLLLPADALKFRTLVVVHELASFPAALRPLLLTFHLRRKLRTLTDCASASAVADWFVDGHCVARGVSRDTRTAIRR